MNLFLIVFSWLSAYLYVIEVLHDEFDVTCIEFLLLSVQTEALFCNFLYKLVAHVYKKLFDFLVHVDVRQFELDEDVLEVGLAERSCHSCLNFSLCVHRQQIKFKCRLKIEVDDRTLRTRSTPKYSASATSVTPGRLVSGAQSAAETEELSFCVMDAVEKLIKSTLTTPTSMLPSKTC